MKTKLLLLAVAVFLLTFALASAAPGGASTSTGASETNAGTSVSTVNIEGGNVTYVDVNSDVVTGRWAGFFGNVSGSIILADTAGSNFYQWTVSNMTGAAVYAASASISDWSGANIVPLTESNTPAFLQTAATDNFNNTFAANEAFVSASLNEAATPYTTTYNSSGVAGNLKTYALYSTADTADIWAGLAVNDADGFNAATVDYQILVPAQSSTSYSFYLELP